MFCSKCGKEINYDSPVCHECISTMANESQNENVNEVKETASPILNQQGYAAPATNQPSYSAPVPSQPSYAAPLNSEVPPYAINPAPVYQPQPRPQQQPPLTIPGGKSSRMEGFGGALAAVILSTVGVIFFYIITYATALAGIGAYAFSMFLAAVPFIVSLVLGIKSITTFVSVKRSGRPVPIATLIMGIEALATSATMILSLLVGVCAGSAVACSYDYDDYYYGSSYI